MGYTVGDREKGEEVGGCTLAMKSVRLQAKYLGTRRTKITIHGVPVDISGDRLGAFFVQYGGVEQVSASVSKVGLATGDIVLHVTLTRRSFGEIHNTLMCWERIMPIVVEGRPHC